MPIYEYQCQSCGDRSEVMQRVSDPPLETCEQCGGALRKLISAPAFQFKGSGWYVTDYARKGGDGAKKAAEETSKDGSDDAGKSSPAASSGDSSSDGASKASAGQTKTERLASSDG